MPGAAITPLKTLSEEAKTSFRRAWVEKFRGADNSNTLAILDPGMTLTPYGIDLTKAQPIEATEASLA